MMKTIQKNVTVNSSIERIFTIIRVLLAVSPFMALGYLTAKGTAGANLQTILSQNPQKRKNHFLRDISGSIVVLIFAGIYMFAMLQLK